MGDLNCDLLHKPIHDHTKRFIFWCEMFQLHQLIDKPTHFWQNKDTLIDVICTSVHNQVSSHGVIHVGYARHAFVYCVYTTKMPKQQHRTIEYRCFKNYDKDKFTEELKHCPWQAIEAFEDIDDAYGMWKDMFLEICDKHCPLVKRRVRKKISYLG